MNAEIVDLQIKVAHLEASMDALNAVIVRQDRIIQDLQDQLKLIYRQMDTKADAGIAPFDLLEDRPPHY